MTYYKIMHAFHIRKAAIYAEAEKHKLDRGYVNFAIDKAVSDTIEQLTAYRRLDKGVKCSTVKALIF